jgi:hypothetical protein
MFGETNDFGDFASLLVLTFWQLAVWAALGGAISRIAALGLTRGEAPDFPNSLRFAKRNYASFFSAPLFNLLGVLLTALPLVLLGLLMRLDWLAIVAALIWPIVLVIGLGVAGLAIGLALGFPLLWAAIAVEETDAFDAISRMYAYFYQRPLRLFWYVLVAAAFGWLGGAAIELLLTATRSATEGSVALSRGEGPFPPAAERIIRFWTGGLSVVRAAYYFGYYWCAGVGIYLLLRRDIDSVQLDEVAIEDIEPYKPSGTIAGDNQIERSSSTRA